MSDLFGNHIVGFPTRWLNYVTDTKADFLVQLLHYIPGVTFLEAGNPLDLLPEVGRLVGRMDTALKVHVCACVDDNVSVL